jgi:hypothetical protein
LIDLIDDNCEYWSLQRSEAAVEVHWNHMNAYTALFCDAESIAKHPPKQIRLKIGSLVRPHSNWGWHQLRIIDILPLLHMRAKHPSFECRTDFEGHYHEELITLDGARNPWWAEQCALNTLFRHSDPDWTGALLGDTFANILVYLGANNRQEIHLVYRPENSARFKTGEGDHLGPRFRTRSHMMRFGFDWYTIGFGVFDFLIKPLEV